MVRMLAKFKNHLLVTKPGIVAGNMLSVAGGFLLAAKGRAIAGELLSTIIGVSLVVASGCVLNNLIDRDMDRKMSRTRNRVLANGHMSPTVALFYALLLGVAGTAWLWATTNRLCVAIVLAGLIIYTLVYSLYLKRRSVYATLVGSLAGAAPPLAGYCAASGRFDTGAAILLLIFILWQVPHSYASAIYRLGDYHAAAIPVLPVRQGIAAAKRQIIGYIAAFTAATLLLTFGGYAGYGYLTAAAVIGLFWLSLAWSGLKASNDRLWARRIFVFSILAMAFLNLMMSIDPAIPPTLHPLLTFGP